MGVGDVDNREDYAHFVFWSLCMAEKTSMG